MKTHSYRFIFNKESHLTAVVRCNTDFKNLPWAILNSLEINDLFEIDEEIDDYDFET